MFANGIKKLFNGISRIKNGGGLLFSENIGITTKKCMKKIIGMP